ncbi:MAG: hypothetical protein V4481_02200 [Patescibacteria group bacterium]
MKSRSTTSLIVTLVVLVVVVGIIIAIVRPSSPASTGSNPPVSTIVPSGVACTMDAKACPDGSYVGRIPPTCQFAACPTPVVPGGTPPATVATTTFETGFNQSVTSNGITIIPKAIIEDSRCPIGVQCIQAGTVRVNTSLSSLTTASADYVFALGKPVKIGAVTIELVRVAPDKRSGQTLATSEYKFTFALR